jgi:hypothetical protein
VVVLAKAEAEVSSQTTAVGTSGADRGRKRRSVRGYLRMLTVAAALALVWFLFFAGLLFT